MLNKNIWPDLGLCAFHLLFVENQMRAERLPDDVPHFPLTSFSVTAVLSSRAARVFVNEHTTLFVCDRTMRTFARTDEAHATVTVSLLTEEGTRLAACESGVSVDFRILFLSFERDHTVL